MDIPYDTISYETLLYLNVVFSRLARGFARRSTRSVVKCLLRKILKNNMEEIQERVYEDTDENGMPLTKTSYDVLLKHPFRGMFHRVFVTPDDIRLFCGFNQGNIVIVNHLYHPDIVDTIADYISVYPHVRRIVMANELPKVPTDLSD